MVPAMTGPQKITGLTCLALVVANMIGTGVFTSLGFQVVDIDSTAVILALWMLGGLLAFCGATAYAELALALPRSGGEYHFLSRIFHPAAGFIAGITSATVGFAAPVALASMAFAEYFVAVARWGNSNVLALAVAALVTGVHLISLKTGSRFQQIFTVLKIALIMVFIVAGYSMVAEPLEVSLVPAAPELPQFFSAAFAISLMYVMYSYSGWNAVVYIIGEVHEPRRVVMPALVGGTLFVALLYVLINYVFLRAAPMEAYAGQLEAGQIAATAIFGEAGGRLMSGLICLGLISAISAMMWAGPRVLQVMGEDAPVLRFFAHKNQGGIPARAVIFQFVLVAIFIISGSFESVLLYTQFTLTLCTFATVLGLIVLRFREPDLERPHKCWGYPITPLFFLAITGFTMWHLLFSKTTESLLGLATLAAGLILFYVKRR